MTKVVIVSGEPSGDRHAGHLISELRAMRPEIAVFGMGGDASRDAGMDCWVDIKGLSVIGFIEVLKQYGAIRAALNTMKQRLAEHRPSLVILVDYVEFNLRLAAHAKSLGIKVLFYISPQVWAWRSRRASRIKRCVDAMAVLFPFEVAFYEKANIPVRYVGNPLVDDFEASGGAAYWFGLRDRLAGATGNFCVGLLPGSRDSEIERHLGMMVETARLLQAKGQPLRLVLALAPNLSREQLILQRCKAEGIAVCRKASEVFEQAHVILTSSGTATLEAGLHSVPMVVVYKTSPITYFFLKRMILIAHIALVNIVSEKAVVEEFLQDRATPEALSAAIWRLLKDRVLRLQMTKSLQQIRAKLGDPGGSKRVAAMALELLDHGRIKAGNE
jgi:lipid-A-disaccharide synthase